MSDQATLTWLHGVVWPFILTLLWFIRRRKPRPSLLAEHIYWFTNRPTWITTQAKRLGTD